ncbi:MAG: glycosyltransferase [Bacteroidales bacterium]|nr:glycosyltransferase [Bacteroidales bacterium]
MMKVLQLCSKPPRPTMDGGTMAMDSITRGLLSAGCKVKVLTIETDKHPFQREALTSDYLAQTEIEAVRVDLDFKILPAAVNTLCGDSYHVKRYVSQAFGQKLKEILQNEPFDVVHIESLFLLPYIPLIRHFSDAPVVLRAHNVEHLIWQRMAAHTSNRWRRGLLKQDALALRAYELEHINDCDGVACITREDADFFRSHGCRRPIEVVPIGVEVNDSPSKKVDNRTLYHIGAMDWKPNQEAVDWLLKEVWPTIHRAVPQAKLHLAGRKMPAEMMQKDAEGVEMHGEVADAKEFIADKHINIVPLLSGSGMRVKIIEAMAMGKTVISTSIGAQGIDYVHGENILIANTPDEFASCVRRCIEDTQYSRHIGEAAQRLVRDRYSLHTTTSQLMAFYNRIIEKQ